MKRLFLTLTLLFPMLFSFNCIDPSSNDEEDTVILADMYEPDNSRSTAKPFHPDSGSQVRTIKRNDTDWVSFSAVSGTAYRIFTGGSTDTRIKIFSTSSTVPLIEGDDSPNSLNALVVFNCTSTSTYYIAVLGNDETVTGQYDLSVTTSEGPDSYEQDSIPMLARAITPSSAQSRTISEGDVDWVIFSISSNDTVLFTATGTCRTTLVLYDRDSSSKLFTAAPGDSSTQLRHYLATSGSYFLRITAGTAGKSGTYRLTMQSSSSGTLVTGDAYENDNTRSTAKLLPGSSVLQNRSLIPGDTDWVKLPVISGRQYTLNFSGISAVRASMYAKDGSELQREVSSIFLNSSATDTVFVKIYSTSTVAVSYPLILSIMLQPSVPDDYEPDNTKILSKPKCAVSDSFIQDRTLTYLNSVPDTDWVAFPVSAGKMYSISISASVSTSLYMYLYDNAGTLIRSSTSSTNSFTYTPTVTDTMYLSIYRPSYTTPLAYTLSIYGQFSNDSYEPDSTRLTAKTLSLTSSSAQSRMLLPGDNDWVVFTVTPGDSIAIQTSGSTDTKLALFTSSGSTPELENDDIGAGNTNSLISWKSNGGGQYYIRVSGKTSATSGAYSLQALSVVNLTMVAPDSLESDNVKSSARFVTDTLLSAQYHSLHISDTDWVAFPVQAGGQYTISVSSLSNSLNFYGYTSRDSLVASRLSTTSGSISYTPKTADTLYIRISSTMSIARYYVAMSRVAPPSSDTYESDNTKATARLITDSILTNEIHSLTGTDTDWVAFPVVSGGQYTFTFSSSVSTYNFNVYAYTAKDTLYASRTSAYNTSITRVPTYNDTMYFRIASTMLVPRYTISMSRIAPYPADPYEYDNIRSLAKPIIADSTQSHTIAMQDSDWIKIVLESGASYRITTNATFYHYAYIYFGTSTSYANMNSSSANTFNVTGTGETLFVLIRQYSASTSYIGPYTIKIGKRVDLPNKAVAAGYSHSMILKTDGTLWGVGDNSYGQIGDGTSSTKLSPVQVASGVISVAASYMYSMFVKSDSSLWAMGNNSSYQLGDGTSTSKTTPVKTATGVASVALGYYHAIMVKNDHTAWATGQNSYGQLGDGTTTSKTSPVKVMDSVESVGAGYYCSYFIKLDGSLWVAGQNTNGQLGSTASSNQLTPLKIMENVRAVSGGYGHSLFLKADSSVWAVGLNTDGQLGNGSSVSITTPVQVITGAAAIAGGQYHSLFVKGDGTLLVAGRNTNGQLGVSSTSDVLTPATVATGVVAASTTATATFSLIIKSNATAWGTGTNTYGQLGDGTSTSKTLFVQMVF